MQIRPGFADLVTYGRQQAGHRKSHDKQNSEQAFNLNDPVFVKNYHQGPAWLPGEVITSSPRNYKIQLRNGALVCRHVDQMRSRAADMSTVGDTNTGFEDFQSSENSSSSEILETSNTEGPSSEPTTTLHRSTRNR